MYSELVNELKALREHSKKTEKEEILKRNENNHLFKRVLNYLADGFQTINISTKKLQKSVAEQEFTGTLEELLDVLLENGTGNEVMVGKVQAFLRRLPEKQADVLSEVIAKSWTTTVGAKVLNEVYGDKFVTTFSVQLAETYEDKIHQFNEDDKFYVTQKMDGVRAIIHVIPKLKDGKLMYTKDCLKMYTRSGRQMKAVSEVYEHIIEFIEANQFLSTSQYGYVLDGELVAKNVDNLSSGDLFRLTKQMVSRKEESNGLEYYLFDIISLEDFKNAESVLSYDKRRKVMDSFNSTESVHVLQTLALITKADVPIWSSYASQQGWEGIMLNHVDSPYITKRHKGLLKVKGSSTADLEVIGFVQAIDGQYKGSLQSLVIKLDEENTVLVGSGLSVELRHDIWNNQDKYLGKIVEIEYFEKSYNQQGGWSLRHPVFKAFRFDKTVDDVNID